MQQKLYTIHNLCIFPSDPLPGMSQTARVPTQESRVSRDCRQMLVRRHRLITATLASLSCITVLTRSVIGVHMGTNMEVCSLVLVCYPVCSLGCGRSMRRRLLEDHERRICTHRKIPCKWQVRIQSSNYHISDSKPWSRSRVQAITPSGYSVAKCCQPGTGSGMWSSTADYDWLNAIGSAASTCCRVVHGVDGQRVK